MTTSPPPQPDALPTWDECQAALEAGEMNRLQEFIIENTPGDAAQERMFRDELSAVLAEVLASRAPAPPGPAMGAGTISTATSSTRCASSLAAWAGPLACMAPSSATLT